MAKHLVIGNIKLGVFEGVELIGGLLPHGRIFDLAKIFAEQELARLVNDGYLREPTEAELLADAQAEEEAQRLEKERVDREAADQLLAELHKNESDSVADEAPNSPPQSGAESAPDPEAAASGVGASDDAQEDKSSKEVSPPRGARKVGPRS